MHIFIDESGTFTRSASKGTSVSAVGALVLRDGSIKSFEKLYGKIRRNLPKENGEVKGRLLSENDVSQVTSVLKKVGAIFEVVAIDLAHESDDEIVAHQKRQAENLTKDLTDEFHPNFVSEVWKLRHTLEKLPIQLYIQSVIMTQLVYDSVNHADTYLSLRFPNELSRYSWVIDAKDKTGVTSWEEWWATVVLPFLESKSMREPFMQIEGGDYTAHERFRTAISEYKSEKFGKPLDGEFFDLRMLMKESFRFSHSPEFGLEAVDILVNAIRRSMSGNFKRDGWLPVRQLMIHRSQQYISLVTFASEPRSPNRPPYKSMLNDFMRGGRIMLTPSLYN